jgi:hypothetical protein
MTISFQLSNEFGKKGPRALSHLICVSDLTVVWGPVYTLIQDAYQNGSSLMSPEFFLELVERKNGPVRITAREEWLRDKRYRNKYAARKWAGAAWKDSFDSRISEILDDDLSLNLPNELRRVVVAPPDPGWDKAKEKLASCFPETKSKLEEIAKDVASLPLGIAERIKNNIGEHHPIESMLRDILDHDIASRESGSNMSFLDDTYLSLVRRISNAGVEVFPSRGFAQGKGLNVGEVSKALDLLQPLSNVEIFESWFSEDRATDRKRLLRLFETDHKVSIKEELLQRLLAAGKFLDNSIWQEMFPDLYASDKLRKMVGFGKLVQVIFLLFSSPLEHSTALLRTPVHLTARGLRRKGFRFFPVTSVVDIEQTGTSEVFQLVFGTKTPSEPQFRDVIQALKREAQRLEDDT